MVIDSSISRYKAASVHLAISAVIAAVILAIMLALWYPPSLFRAMGGMGLIALIVGVDVVIGPLITLIIFDTRKKELVFDLMVIGALQIAALSYGVYAMHAGRPVFIVFDGQRLAVASAADIDPEELAKAPHEEFRHLSLTGPRLAAVVPPEDPQERETLMFAGLTGFGIHQLPKYFVPYAKERSQILATARPLGELAPNAEDARKLEAYLDSTKKDVNQMRYLPVATRHASVLGIIDGKSGELLDILRINPAQSR